jgi:hypothetical protein
MVEARERRALTVLCGEITELRAECAHHTEERQNLLARIEIEARARRPVLGLLLELLGGVQEETARALSTGLPGSSHGQADEERFGCSDGACDRVSIALPAGPVPRCPLTGEPMRRR